MQINIKTLLALTLSLFLFNNVNAQEISVTGSGGGGGGCTPSASAGQLLYSASGTDCLGITGWTTNGTTALTGGASTTLAIGGATIGANALAVTGDTSLNGIVQVGATANSGFIASNVGILTRVGSVIGGAMGNDGTGGPIILVNNTGRLGFTGTNISTTTVNLGDGDLFIQRDAADTLAQRRTSTSGGTVHYPQTFRIYNRYVDASNNEYLSIDWTADTIRLLTAANGSGTGRNMIIGTGGAAGTLTFRTIGTSRWTVDASGHFVAATDNTYDIGASGATRPRSIYIGTDGTFGGTVLAANYVNLSAGQFIWAGLTRMSSPSAGIIRLTDNAQTDFNRLQFGGTTSSFPALKRNGTTLEVKLADDSAYAPIAIGNTVNVVSPTSPNRTVTINIGGTTYYLAAKTTND